MQNKQLLIFDFDGTLIDSVPDLAAAINIMLEQLGLPTYSLDTIKGWVGNGSRLLVERFLDAYSNLKASKTVAYPDVDKGLKQLHDAGFTLALVTNKPIRFVPKILRSFGWQDWFVVVLGGDSLPTKKPDPAPLLHVCDKLGVMPDKAVMIGDSKNDILAGQNAGMDTLALSYGYNYGQDIRDFQPTQAFDNFATLTRYLLDKKEP